MAWEFTVTEKNFPRSHISPSLKVKLLDQINVNYSPTFLLNSTGFTSRNVNGLNIFQIILLALEGQADSLPQIQCGSVPVFDFPVTITCSHGHPRAAWKGGGPSSCPNLAMLVPYPSVSISWLHCLLPPTGIDSTSCLFTFIFLTVIQTHCFKESNRPPCMGCEQKSPVPTLSLSRSLDPSTTFQGQLHLNPEAISSYSLL